MGYFLKYKFDCDQGITIVHDVIYLSYVAKHVKREWSANHSSQFLVQISFTSFYFRHFFRNTMLGLHPVLYIYQFFEV